MARGNLHPGGCEKAYIGQRAFLARPRGIRRCTAGRTRHADERGYSQNPPSQRFTMRSFHRCRKERHVSATRRIMGGWPPSVGT